MTEISPSVMSNYQAIHWHLKCKTALYQYFAQRRKALLPALKSCDEAFLRQLLAGEKLLVVKAETLPSDEALAGLSLSRKKLTKLCSHHPVLRNYLPDDLRRVPLDHLARLLYALDPGLYAREVKGVQDSEVKPVPYKSYRNRYLRREFADILLKLQPMGDGRDEDFLSPVKVKKSAMKEGVSPLQTRN